VTSGSIRGKPGVSNLLTIFGALHRESIEELEPHAGKGYGASRPM